MQALNDIIERRRQGQVMAELATMTAADQADITEAESAVNGLGAAITAAEKELAAAARQMPGGQAVYNRSIQPLVRRSFSELDRLMLPLRRFGLRAQERQAQCDCDDQWDKDWGGPISAVERKRTLSTRVFPFCRARFESGALSKTFTRTGLAKTLALFDRGKGESRTPWGHASGNVSEFDSNLLEKGTLRPGEIFQGYGFAFDVVPVDGSPAVAADVEKIGRGLTRWSEQHDQHKINHRLVKHCPMPAGVDQQHSATFTGARFIGEPYLNESPILRLRGDRPDSAADKGHALEIVYEDDTVELTQDYYLYAWILGELLQAPGGK